MPETTEQKNTVQNVGGSKPQVGTSANTEPTASQPGQILPTARYSISKVGEPILGDEVVKLANQGRMFRQKESELHKTQAEMQKMATEYKQTLEELNRIKQEQIVKEQVSRLMPRKQANNEDEDMFAEEGKESKQIDLNTDEIVRQFRQVAEEPVKRLRNQIGLQDDESAPDINTFIEQRIQQREAELARQKETEGFIQQVRKSDAEQLRTKFGSALPDERIAEVLDMLDVGVTLQRRAEATITDPDLKPQAYDDYGNSRELLLKAVDTLADAKIKKQELDRQAEIDQQLATGQFPGAENLPQVPNDVTFNPRELEKRRKAWIEQDLKKAEMKAALQKARGPGR